LIAVADIAVTGVHITRLLPDGSDRERGEQAKIMIGRSIGSPPPHYGDVRRSAGVTKLSTCRPQASRAARRSSMYAKRL
jgi:hypothetical protein